MIAVITLFSDAKCASLLLTLASELNGLDAVMPAWTDENRDRYLDAAQRSLLGVGITSVGDAAVDLEGLEFLRRREAQGRLAIRLYGMLACPAGNARCSDEAAERGFPHLPSLQRPGRLTVRTVKLFADGALGSWGSAMWEGYADRPDSRGLLLIAEREVRPLIQHWVDAGWQVATHAIGDRANSIVLDAYAAVLSSSVPRGKDLRPRVEHAQLLRLNDTARFASLGVIASMQPTHCTSDMGYVEKRLGAARSRGAYAWQTILG